MSATPTDRPLNHSTLTHSLTPSMLHRLTRHRRLIRGHQSYVVERSAAAEIWTALGYGGEAGVFTASELPVAAIALLALAAVMAVKNNLRAFW